MSHMKRPVQCAEQQVWTSNLTKYCEWLSWLIIVTYETSFTLRGATGITLPPQQIPQQPRKIALQNLLREICRGPLKRHLPCAADSSTIRTQTRHLAPARSPSLLCAVRTRNCSENYTFSRSGYLESIQISPNTALATKSDTARSPNIAPMIRTCSEPKLAISHPPIRRVYFSRLGDAFCTENYNISRSTYLYPNFTKYCTCHEQWHCNITTYCTCHESDTATSPNFVPATKNDTATVPSIAPATKSDTELLLDLNCYLTELLLDWAVTWLNCYLTELFLNWTVTLLNCYFTELLLYWTVTLLRCYFTELLLYWAATFTELLLYWAVATLLNSYFTELLLYRAFTLLSCYLYWAVTLLSCYFTELLLYCAVTLLNCYFIELLLLLNCYFTELLLPYWTLTLRNSYFTELLLYGTVALLDCYTLPSCCFAELLLYWAATLRNCCFTELLLLYFTGLFAFLNCRNSEVSQVNLLCKGFPLLPSKALALKSRDETQTETPQIQVPKFLLAISMCSTASHLQCPILLAQPSKSHQTVPTMPWQPSNVGPLWVHLPGRHWHLPRPRGFVLGNCLRLQLWNKCC